MERSRQLRFLSAITQRDMYMGMARQGVRNRWDVWGDQRPKLERKIRQNVKKARKWNQVAMRLWHEA